MKKQHLRGGAANSTVTLSESEHLFRSLTSVGYHQDQN